MFTLRLAAAAVFAVPVVIPTVYLAFKHNADQLSRFVQLTYVIVAYYATPDKGERRQSSSSRHQAWAPMAAQTRWVALIMYASHP